MSTKINIPVLMRDDSGEPVKVATGVYDQGRGTFRFRVDLNTLKGEHFLFGKAIDLGLVEALQLRVIASDLGIEAVVEQEQQEEEFDLESIGASEENPNRIAGYTE